MNPQHIQILSYVLAFTVPFTLSSFFHTKERYYPFLVTVSILSLFFFSSVLISFREVEGDTLLYSNLFSRASYSEGLISFITENRVENGFLILVFLLANIGLDYQFLFFVVPVFFCYSYYLMAKKIFINFRTILLCVSFFVVLSPFFYSLNGNVIRQALCSGCLFLMYRACLSERYFLAIISVFFAGAFHSIGYFGFVLIAYSRLFDFKPFHWFALLILVSALSLIGVFGSYIGVFFNSFDSDYYHRYGDGMHAYYELGFRFDFYLMNLFPFIALWVLKSNVNKEDEIIITMSCIWSLLHIASFSVPYSDRIGVNSWILYPLVIGLLMKYKLGISLKRC